MSMLSIEAMIAVATAIIGALGWLWRTAAKAASKATRLENCIEDLEDDLVKEETARKTDAADLRHDIKNLASKQDALDRSHNATIQRVVATEATILAMKGAIDRTERNVDELVKIQRKLP